MTDFSQLLLPDRGEPAHLLHLVTKAGADAWIATQSAPRQALLRAARFDGAPGQLVVLPAPEHDRFEIALSVTDPVNLTPWCLAAAAEKLPAGSYRLADGAAPGLAALGWLLAQHRFDRFKSKPAERAGPRVLLSSEPARVRDIVELASATALVRDLVDTPAGDLGPAEFEDIVRQRAKAWDAAVTVTAGDALEQGYPMVAAVGRAASRDRAPRLIELEWGNPAHPRLAVIGKGVCFDSGGLDIKPASGMRLMKKDMGGAAHALALAQLIIAARLPVRLHLLIPAVENAVSGNAFRPGDILVSRAGTTVEIDNTDAEGRLVLADAITRAGEQAPKWIIDFATLTGAARVALGPDLPAMFANDEPLAAALTEAAAAVSDPLWRMPLWDGYDDMLKSELADLANSAESPFAGSVTAALFLRRFVPEGTPWAHFDTFAWRPAAKPGRPKGGEALGLRAAFAALTVLIAGSTSG